MIEGYVVYTLLSVSKKQLTVKNQEGQQITIPLVSTSMRLRPGTTVVCSLDHSTVLAPGTSRANAILRKYRIRKQFIKTIRGSPYEASYLQRVTSTPESTIYTQIMEARVDQPVCKLLEKRAFRPFKVLLRTGYVSDYKNKLLALERVVRENGAKIQYYGDDLFAMTGSYNYYATKPYKYVANMLREFPQVVQVK